MGVFRDVPRGGEGLRECRDVGGVLRLRDGCDGDRHCQHAGAVAQARAGATGFPDRADRGGVLHRCGERRGANDVSFAGYDGVAVDRGKQVLTNRPWCQRAPIILSGIVISAGFFSIARADNVQRCLNAPRARTLDFALTEQEETNQRAALLKDFMKSFNGWRAIPSDVKIVSGPTTIHVLYPTDIKPLPAARSEAAGRYGAESILKVDCMAVDPQGGLWAVIHDRNGSKSYLDAKDTDKTPKAVQ